MLSTNFISKTIRVSVNKRTSIWIQAASLCVCVCVCVCVCKRENI